ncbi:hypothetical protein KJ632_05465, partial [Patescibacteria group bacterium]|nr:hypothetical protein [Patescibacteria group bacterium]
MKVKIALTTVLATLLSLLPTSATQNTAEAAYASNHTPSRPSTQYEYGVRGYDYTTFNNFSHNSYLMGYLGTSNEMEFLAGKLCEKGTNCDNSNYAYANETTANHPLVEGDKVRFLMYFHNNSSDPYDGDNIGSANTNADNLYIGVDLRDSIYDENIARPKGFIYADNNRYKNSNNKIINYREGDYIFTRADNGRVGDPAKTASDDMVVRLSDTNLKLKPVKDSAFLIVTKNPNLDFDQGRNFEDYIKDQTTISLEAIEDYPGGTNYPLRVNPNANSVYDQNMMWLHFDEVPGCFRYSGLVYFDAEIVRETPPENICTNLDANWEFTGNYKDGKPLHKLNIESLSFTNDEDYLDSYGKQFKWTSEDPEGRFYAKLFGILPLAAVNINNRTNVAYTPISNFFPIRDIYYTGNGPVKAELVSLGIENENDVSNLKVFEVNPQPNWVNSDVCFDTMQISNGPNQC